MLSFIAFLGTFLEAFLVAFLVAVLVALCLCYLILSDDIDFLLKRSAKNFERA